MDNPAADYRLSDIGASAEKPQSPIQCISRQDTQNDSTSGSIRRKTSRVSPTLPADNESAEQHRENKGDAEEPKPLALCQFYTKRHKLAFGLMLGLHFFMLVLMGVLFVSGVEVIELNFSGVPLNLLENPTYLRMLAWTNKDEDGTVTGKDTDAATIGERSRLADSLVLYYQGSGTVFTAARLKEIEKAENKLLATPDYQKYCRLPPGNTAATGSCMKPISILRFFDGTFGASFTDPTFSDVTGTLYRVSQDAALNQILQFHLAKDAVITSTEARSSTTRTLIYFGYPFAGYNLKTDNVTKQLEELRDFEVNELLDMLDAFRDDGVADMDFLYYGGQLLMNALLKQVILDMSLSVGSMFFIFIFMLIMTKSLFTTFFGIFSILSSFAIACLLYRFIFQYTYFGIFHVLSIFIILGIGADNVFVFMDTWRATAHADHPSLEHRLSACFRRAASATLFTSLTTMAAFLSNALSPLLAISSFGLFSAILVFVNYMSVILFFPTVIVMYHKHWETWTWPCFRCCKKKDPEDPSGDTERHHPIVRFFRGPFFTLVTHRIIRFVLLGLCLAMIVLFSVFAAQLEPDEEQIKFYKDSHPTTKATKLQQNGFKPSTQDDVIEVYIVWGLRNQDLSDCDKSSIDCKGKTVWDAGFDLNPKRAQSAMLDFCDKIQNLPASEVNKLKIRRNAVTNKLEMECFVDRINSYMQAEGVKYNPSLDLVLPTSEAKVSDLILENQPVYNVTTVSPLLYRYFETMMGFWLNDGYAKQGDYYDYTVYTDLLGEGRDAFDTRPVASDPSMSWATKLQYAAVVVNTTIKSGAFSFERGIPIVEDWDRFIENELFAIDAEFSRVRQEWLSSNFRAAKMPSTVGGMFHCTPRPDNPWHFFYVQRELTKTAIMGIVIGLLLALIVITVATKNIITSTLATLNIGVVTLSVVGLIPMLGWKLGVLESLNLSLVVGLAVDYVVHLAEGYHDCPAQDRLARTRHMLDHVGVSILSGALTTLGAAMFMFAAVILFFMQFGIFMFCTIGFSLFYSLFGFSVLMGLLGPQGQTGSLVPLVWWIRFRLRGKKSHHVTCKQCTGTGFHDMLPENGIKSEGTDSVVHKLGGEGKASEGEEMGTALAVLAREK